MLWSKERTSVGVVAEGEERPRSVSCVACVCLNL